MPPLPSKNQLETNLVVLLLQKYSQVFVLDGTKATAHYNYLQDLANLNMPAGEGSRVLGVLGLGVCGLV
jgi:hypothetical protein